MKYTLLTFGTLALLLLPADAAADPETALVESYVGFADPFLGITSGDALCGNDTNWGGACFEVEASEGEEIIGTVSAFDDNGNPMAFVISYWSPAGARATDLRIFCGENGDLDKPFFLEEVDRVVVSILDPSVQAVRCGPIVPIEQPALAGEIELAFHVH